MSRVWFNAVLVAGVGVAMLTWLHPADADFSVAGRGWNGLRDAADQLAAMPLAADDEYDSLASPGTLILVPAVPLEANVTERIGSFVRDGGVLVLLDDYGSGNDVLEALGAPLRFSGAPLVDPLHCDTNETMPKASVATVSATGALSLVLNHGTWLEVREGADLWARSSYFSYGDTDNDGQWDEGEPQGPLPVGARWRSGDGEVVVAADASLLINAMLDRSDNLEAISSFVRAPVYIDQVHHATDTSLDRNKQRMERLRSVVSYPAVVAIVVVVVIAAALWYGWYVRRTD